MPIILYVVYCHMFCAICSAASYYCMLCSAMRCEYCRFVPRALLLHISYAVYCHMLCSLGTAASYYCMLCTDIRCGYCSFFCQKHCCFIFCMLCTAACFVLRALLLHILYDVRRGHCHFVPWALLLFILYVIDRHIFCVHCCFIYVVNCELTSF